MRSGGVAIGGRLRFAQPFKPGSQFLAEDPHLAVEYEPVSAELADGCRQIAEATGVIDSVTAHQRDARTSL